MKYYDLHIHSCLSPCADNEMTPCNIVGMAKVKGLDLIAVTDHNSTLTLPAVKQAAGEQGIELIYGCEVQTREEVHILAYFQTEKARKQFQKFLDATIPSIPNRPDFFGEQLIMDGNDQVIGTESRLLLVSLDADLDSCVQAIHKAGGIAVPAHIIGKSNGLIEQLGFIPETLAFDALEIRSESDRELVLSLHPWLVGRDVLWLINSDAHQLIDISEPEHLLDEARFNRLWEPYL